MADEAPTRFQIPAHVQPELVRDYDYIAGPELMAHPPCAVESLRDQGRIFYTTVNGGAWVLTRYADIRAAFQDAELFPQWGKGVFARTYIPLMLDPPEHHTYRKLLLPLLSPGRVRALEQVVRQTAREQLAKIAPTGRCEFVADFAIVLPAAMFCGLLGLPVERFAEFNEMSFDLIYAPAQIRLTQGDEAANAHRVQANQRIEAFILSMVARRKSEPGDDMISFLLNSKIGDRPMTDDEVFNISTLMFFAGTDSTGSLISYAFAYLARHPDLRQRIIDDPSVIPQATDELTRFHGFHHIVKRVSRDAEFAGASLRKNDLVLLPTGGANHDPDQFPDPHTVDFSRESSSHHLTFGAGVHRCIGAPLATLELRVALEEVHKVITDYRLDPEDPVTYVSGLGKTIPQRVPMLFSPSARSTSTDAGDVPG